MLSALLPAPGWGALSLCPQEAAWTVSFSLPSTSCLDRGLPSRRQSRLHAAVIQLVRDCGVLCYIGLHAHECTRLPYLVTGTLMS